MNKCDNCRLRKESAKAFDIHWHGKEDCPYDKCPVPDLPKTNADRIRSMTDEELANWLGIYCRGAIPANEPCVNSFNSCEECWLDWLRQEAKE